MRRLILVLPLLYGCGSVDSSPTVLIVSEELCTVFVESEFGHVATFERAKGQPLDDFVSFISQQVTVRRVWWEC